MSLRLPVAGCFLLLTCAGALAGDPPPTVPVMPAVPVLPAVVPVLPAIPVASPAPTPDPDAGVMLYAPGIATNSQAIPILTSTDTSTSANGHWQETINPLVVTRAPNVMGTSLADTDDQYVDVGYHLPVFSMFTVGYDTAVNAFRQDQTIWDDEEATSEITTAIINKASLDVQTTQALKWTGYVQYQRSLTDGQPGFSDATKPGGEVAWTPVKDVTTVKVDASTQTTYNFDHSILDEKLYTSSVDQKLPYVPVTLHTAGSIADDSSPTIASDDRQNTILDTSLLWKIVPSTSLSGGYQRQDTNTPTAMTLQDTNVYFSQVAVQPAQAWTVTMRAAHEDRAATQAGEYLSNGSDVLLSLGLNWVLSDRFNAGAGVNYRLLESQSPAASSSQSTPPATFSISAGGNF